jgi:hypothetical protein
MSADAVVREFTNEAEAALAAAVLEANGIRAELRGVRMWYHTTMAGPTAVMVRSEDVAQARHLLDTPADVEDRDTPRDG